MRVIRKITGAKQLAYKDPSQLENLGGQVSRGQMLAKIEKLWKQLDSFNNAECMRI